jgi:hypothetical protein
MIGRKHRLRLGWTCCSTCHTTHSNKMTAWLHWLWLQCVAQVRLLATPAGKDQLAPSAVACLGCAEPQQAVADGQNMAVCSVCESVFLSKRVAENMVKARKPHIRPRRSVGRHRSWVCSTVDGNAGYGLSPAAAYGAWLALRDQPRPNGKEARRIKIRVVPTNQTKESA